MHAPNVNSAAEVSAAVERGWLPDGWKRKDGIVIVPDAMPDGRVRGHSTIMAMLDEIRTESGRVIKSRDGR